MESQEQRVERPWWSFGCVGLMTPTDIRNLGRYNALMLAWALTWCASLLTLASGRIESPVLRALVAAVPVAVMVAALAAYLHFLRHADELLRKIQVEGLGLGFAVGLIVATSWRLLERAGAGAIDPTVIGSLMLVGWAAGQAIARRRYL